MLLIILLEKKGGTLFLLVLAPNPWKNGEKSEDGKRKREVVSKIISNNVIFDHFTMKNWFSKLFLKLIWTEH